jgi:hypothetical protein
VPHISILRCGLLAVTPSVENFIRAQHEPPLFFLLSFPKGIRRPHPSEKMGCPILRAFAKGGPTQISTTNPTNPGAPHLDTGVPNDRSSSLGWFEMWVTRGHPVGGEFHSCAARTAVAFLVVIPKGNPPSPPKRKNGASTNLHHQSHKSGCPTFIASCAIKVGLFRSAQSDNLQIRAQHEPPFQALPAVCRLLALTLNAARTHPSAQKSPNPPHQNFDGVV